MRWDNMVVECVLDIRRFIRDAPQAHEVRVVLGEQQFGIHRVFLTFGAVVDRLAVGSDRGTEDNTSVSSRADHELQ
jgi:hypothetical protein